MAPFLVICHLSIWFTKVIILGHFHNVYFHYSNRKHKHSDWNVWHVESSKEILYLLLLCLFMFSNMFIKHGSLKYQIQAKAMEVLACNTWQRNIISRLVVSVHIPKYVHKMYFYSLLRTTSLYYEVVKKLQDDNTKKDGQRAFNYDLWHCRCIKEYFIMTAHRIHCGGTDVTPH